MFRIFSERNAGFNASGKGGAGARFPAKGKRVLVENLYCNGDCHAWRGMPGERGRFMSRRSARDIETEHGFARRATAFCLRLTVVCLLRSLPLLLIFGGVAYGAVSLWQAGIADERFMIRGDTLSLSLPSRLSAEAVYKIEELGKFPRPRSILDPFLDRKSVV